MFRIKTELQQHRHQVVLKVRIRMTKTMWFQGQAVIQINSRKTRFQYHQDSYSAEHTSSPLQSVHKEDRITTKSTEIQDEAMRFHRLGDGAPICKRLHNVKFNANQPRFEDVVTLPFDPKKVYERRISDNKYIHRQWVTVKVTDRTVMGVYCNVCLAFAHSDSAFTNGFTTYSHIYQRISEHESSKSHNVSVTELFHAQSGTDIAT